MARYILRVEWDIDAQDGLEGWTKLGEKQEAIEAIRGQLRYALLDLEHHPKRNQEKKYELVGKVGFIAGNFIGQSWGMIDILFSDECISTRRAVMATISLLIPIFGESEFDLTTMPLTPDMPGYDDLTLN